MNFLGEAYINFGYIGIPIFAFALGRFVRFLDQSLAELVDGHAGVFGVFSLFFLGLIFFVLRGDLLSSFAYSCGLLASTWFAYSISAKRLRLRLSD